MAQQEDLRDPRIYMAAERTFLAWIRTGLALMAFGFVVARFAVLSPAGAVAAADGGRPPGGELSVTLGVALVTAGLLTFVASAVRHDRYVRAIDDGQFRAAFGSTLAYAIVAMLVILAGLMILSVLRS